MPKVKYDLRGVGLLLFSEKGRILVLKELISKPVIQKRKGMLSFPLETLEDSESPKEGVQRLIHEEIGNVSILDIKEFGTFEFYHPTCHVTIHAFSGSTNEEFTANPTDSDVTHHDWMSPQILIKESEIRLEVQPIIESHSRQL